MAITIGIAGITGKFARSVVRYLLKDPDVVIRGYCRDPSKLSSALRSSSRINVTAGQARDIEGLRSFVKGCSVVVCAYLGSNELMIDGQKALIDACEAEGVTRYVASDYTLDYRKLEFGQIPMKDVEKTIAHYLKDKTVRGVHVQIGIFMETFWSPFFGVWNEEDLRLSFWGTGDEEWESTTYENAAQFVAEIALDEGVVGFRQFLGDRKSIHEIASIFNRVYDIQLKLHREGSLRDLQDLLRQKRSENPTDVSSYIPLFYKNYCTNGQCYLTDGLDNEKFSRIKPTTFEDFLRSHEIKDLSSTMQMVASGV